MTKKNKGQGDGKVTPLFGRNAAKKTQSETSQPKGRHRSSDRNTTEGGGKPGRHAKPDDKK